VRRFVDPIKLLLRLLHFRFSQPNNALMLFRLRTTLASTKRDRDPRQPIGIAPIPRGTIRRHSHSDFAGRTPRRVRTPRLNDRPELSSVASERELTDAAPSSGRYRLIRSTASCGSSSSRGHNARTRARSASDEDEMAPLAAQLPGPQQHFLQRAVAPRFPKQLGFCSLRSMK
jgi:hypothetical protein